MQKEIVRETMQTIVKARIDDIYEKTKEELEDLLQDAQESDDNNPEV